MLGRFADRREAGRELARELSHLRDEHPVVAGLPRGGVPVAYEIAKSLGARLDVLVVRKLGAPTNPELAIGAVGEGGVTLVHDELVARLRIGAAELDAIVADARNDVDQTVERLRGKGELSSLAGRTVILVDDGIATGATAQAAARVVHERGAGRVVLAVPVASQQAFAMLQQEVDHVVALEVPRDLLAVGVHYRDFSPVSNDDVANLLDPSTS